ILQVGAASAALMTGIAFVLLASMQFQPDQIQPEPLQQPTDVIFSDLSCAVTRILLTDYIDGNLDFETAGSVKQHLEHCGHCWSDYNKLLATLESRPRAILAKADS
ncbi:MAG: zf-HC2 domain-containing protein, partial [Planctomycetales bacterium]